MGEAGFNHSVGLGCALPVRVGPGPCCHVVGREGTGLSKLSRIAARSGMPSRPYKDSVIYGCFVLNRLMAELDIDLHQEGLEAKIDGILAARPASISKEEVKREIRSNHVMTNKVIDALVKDSLVVVQLEEGRYRV